MITISLISLLFCVLTIVGIALWIYKGASWMISIANKWFRTKSYYIPVLILCVIVGMHIGFFAWIPFIVSENIETNV